MNEKKRRICQKNQNIKNFPVEAKRETGYQLDRVQNNLDPTDWKPMPSVGRGVREIRIHHQGQYRVIYIATLKEAVVVLHSFQKKTQKTPLKDIDLARRTLKQVLGDLK